MYQQAVVVPIKVGLLLLSHLQILFKVDLDHRLATLFPLQLAVAALVAKEAVLFINLLLVKQTMDVLVGAIIILDLQAQMDL